MSFPRVVQTSTPYHFILQRWLHAKLMIRVWVHARARESMFGCGTGSWIREVVTPHLTLPPVLWYDRCNLTATGVGLNVPGR